MSRRGTESSPGPGRSCRIGWQWWLRGDIGLAAGPGGRVQAQGFCCPNPGLPGRRRDMAPQGHSPSRKHHLGDSFWHVGDWAPAPSGSC